MVSFITIDATDADVSFGSKAEVAAISSDVRFTLESGHRSAPFSCPLCARSGHRMPAVRYSWPVVIIWRLILQTLPVLMN